MLSQERWMNLRHFRKLKDSGASLAQIARETGCDYRTVKKYLDESASALPPQRAKVTHPPQVIEPFKERTEELPLGMLGSVDATETDGELTRQCRHAAQRPVPVRSGRFASRPNTHSSLPPRSTAEQSPNGTVLARRMKQLLIVGQSEHPDFDRTIPEDLTTPVQVLSSVCTKS